MFILEGIATSPGIAIGPLAVVQAKQPAPTMQTALDIAVESRRALGALHTTQDHIDRLIAENHTPAAHRLLQPLAQLLHSEDFAHNILAIIEGEMLTAEYAAYASGRQFAAIAAVKAGIPWRQHDGEEAATLLLAALSGQQLAGQPKRPAILAAQALSAVQLLGLRQQNLLGLILRDGSPGGPASVLARRLGIPALVQVGDNFSHLQPGGLAVVDSYTRRAITMPADNLVQQYTVRQKALEKERARLAALKGVPTKTRDGMHLTLCADIGHPDELPLVLAGDADGVGLFRSEYLYMHASGLPDEESQLDSYRHALTTLAPRRVIVRLLDIGDAAHPLSIEKPHEPNPAMGQRGIRYALENPGLLLTQLRALLRASAFGQLGIALPFVTHPDELAQVIRVVEQAKEALRQEGEAFSKGVQFGIIVQTPSAVMLADRLAPKLDFFTIDIDSLAMYTFAADRSNPKVSHLPTAGSHAVLRMVYRTVLNARQYGVRAAICGQSAADTSLLPYFIGMGAHELVLPSHAVLAIKDETLRLHAGECRRLVGEVLA